MNDNRPGLLNLHNIGPRSFRGPVKGHRSEKIQNHWSKLLVLRRGEVQYLS